MRELADMLRTLAHGCGSAALACSVHTHQVPVAAWRWRHRKVQPVEKLLRRIADERIILLSSGGSEWIGGSGHAERAEGGWRVTAHKIFTSGFPVGDLVMTGAVVHEDRVIHFAAPMAAPEVRVLDNRHTLGMRGTGSNDVLIQTLLIPDAAVSSKRRAGAWHKVFQIIATIAFPLVHAVYLGVAERAWDVAIAIAKRREPGEDTLTLAGRMDTALRAARLAHDWMLRTAERNEPSAERVNDVMTGRTPVAEHAIRATGLAMELAGGMSFHREHELERPFHDVQGARLHVLRLGPQARYAGAMALGLSVATIH